MAVRTMFFRPFVAGFGWGLAATLLLSAVLVLGGELRVTPAVDHWLAGSPWQAWWPWLAANLGWSLLPFALTLALFLATIGRLRKRLLSGGSLAEVSQLDHLCDVWTGLFFGIGVIWTAVGMRSALLLALGDPHQAAANGALSILSALVEGGILIALSTTIFGGIGGYLMRIYKSCVVGDALRRFYCESANAQGKLLLARLQAIESHLAVGNRRSMPEQTP